MKRILLSLFPLCILMGCETITNDETSSSGNDFETESAIVEAGTDLAGEDEAEEETLGSGDAKVVLSLIK